MRATENDFWALRAEVFAFLGNSLLTPINMTSDVMLQGAFWESLPDLGDDAIRDSLNACKSVVESAMENGVDKAVMQIATEYAKLFIGPPQPAAAPWETMYGPNKAQCGYGRPTFEMRRLLRDSGLMLSNNDKQFEDHMGIELLYLSALCTKAADGRESYRLSALSFAESHPLAWIGSFAEAVNASSPAGYYAALLNVVGSYLRNMCARKS